MLQQAGRQASGGGTGLQHNVNVPHAAYAGAGRSISVPAADGGYTALAAAMGDKDTSARQRVAEQEERERERLERLGRSMAQRSLVSEERVLSRNDCNREGGHGHGKPVRTRDRRAEASVIEDVLSSHTASTILLG